MISWPEGPETGSGPRLIGEVIRNLVHGKAGGWLFSHPSCLWWQSWAPSAKRAFLSFQRRNPDQRSAFPPPEKKKPPPLCSNCRRSVPWAWLAVGRQTGADAVSRVRPECKNATQGAVRRRESPALGTWPGRDFWRRARRPAVAGVGRTVNHHMWAPVIMPTPVGGPVGRCRLGFWRASRGPRPWRTP